MDSQKLIELVRVHEELFDLSHPKYVDVSHKERLWQQIGLELNQTAANCKSRWGNIRDNYRKHLKKMAKKYGQSSANVKRYKFSEQLHFLKQYMQMNETANSIITYKEFSQVKIEPMDETDQLQNEERTNIENNNLTDPEDNNREEQEANEKTDQTTAKSQTKKRSFSSVLPTPKRKFQPKQGETASSTLMKYLLEKKDREEKACHQQPDAVDAFLASLAPTLKTFSPYYLNIAKTRIFSIVQEFELKMIEEANKQPATSRSPSPSLSSSSRGSFIPLSYLSTDYTTLDNSAEQQPQVNDELCEEKPQVQ